MLKTEYLKCKHVNYLLIRFKKIRNIYNAESKLIMLD
jgi:hypothetical protein